MKVNSTQRGYKTTGTLPDVRETCQSAHMSQSAFKLDVTSSLGSYSRVPSEIAAYRQDQDNFLAVDVESFLEACLTQRRGGFPSLLILSVFVWFMTFLLCGFVFLLH